MNKLGLNWRLFSYVVALLFGLTLGQIALFNTFAEGSPITAPISSPVQSPSPTPTASPSATPIPDTTGPVLTILYPQDSSYVKQRSTVGILATATDSSGVADVKFYVNGVQLCNVTQNPYSCNWIVPKKPNVKYTITTVAKDLPGNLTSKSITVTSSAK